MMYKIFYDPRHKDLIMGMSDGDNSMEFPHVKTETQYHSLSNLEVKTDSKKAKFLKIKKGSLTSN